MTREDPESAATRLQDRIIRGALDSLEKGRDVFINAPTGTGKSRKFSRIAEQRSHGGKVLVLSHRRNLVRQGQRNMERWSDNPVLTSLGIDGDLDQTGDVVYSTVQTARANLERLESYRTVVIDEAHHGTKENEEYNQVLEHLIANNPDVQLVAASATPPEGYDGLHPRLAAADKHVMTFEEAVAARLVDLPETKMPRMRYKDCQTIEDIVGRHRRSPTSAGLEGGVSKALAKAREDDWSEQLADQYERHLLDRRTLAFFDSIREASAFVEEVRSRGHNVEIVHSGMSDRKNERNLDDFRSGRIRMLVSVDMISEGYDVDADGVLLDKKTTSSTEYRQIIGREARAHGVGKERRALLIDTGASTLLWGDIGAQAQMQTMRGEIERQTIQPEQLLPDRARSGFRPWIELKAPDGKTPVYATSVDGSIVYAAPAGRTYVACQSVRDRKGSRIELLAIEGERKGAPRQESFGTWISEAVRRNEQALARLLGTSRNGETELARMINEDWKRNAGSIERNIALLSAAPMMAATMAHGMGR